MSVGGNWDRGAPTTVVMSEKQENKRNMKLDATNSWLCECGHRSMLKCSHCTKCGQLRADQRAARMQDRAGQGVGRGGGFFERDSGERLESSSASKPKGYDDFGRRIVADITSTELSKSDRQKAALERLKQRGKRKPSLSPVRERTYRERSSRSREAKRYRDSKTPFFGGGIN